MPPTSQRKKGTLQKATGGSYSGSTKFPFVKRTPSINSVVASSAPSAMIRSNQKEKSVANVKSTKPPTRSLFKKSVKVADVKKQLSKPVKSTKKSMLFFRSKPKKEEETFSSIIRMAKYSIFSLLLISSLISFVYFILYLRDYFQNNNSPEEKKLLRMSIIGSSLIFCINLILLVLVNSYWQILGSFSIPLSIALR